MKDETWIDVWRGYSGHHPWCNFFQEKPAKDCDMCKGLNLECPYEPGSDPDELMAKHFPDNVKIELSETK